MQRNTCICFYYGDVDPAILGWLETCDYAVLPPTLSENVLEELRGAGVETLGYVSIATIGGWEPWAKLVPRDAVIGRNPAWGEAIIDACSSAWRHAYTWALGYIASKGYTGYFLDNLDVVDRYPRMKRCVTDLVALTRRLHPRAVIAVNRCFAILEEIAPYIDILVYESFPTYYDPSTRSYRAWRGQDLEWCLEMLEKALSLSKRYGFTILLLAYAPRGREGEVCRLLEKLRVPPLPLYVAPDELREPGVCNPCRPAENTTTLRYTTTPAASPAAEHRAAPSWLLVAGGVAAGLAAWLGLRASKRRGR